MVHLMLSMRLDRLRGASSTLAAAGCAFLLACRPADDPNGVDTNAIEEPAVNIPVPLPAPPMNRSDLLEAVRQAASAKSSAGDVSALQRQLDGRQFEFRIRFGCRGPSTDLPGELLGWSFEPAKRTLRVRAMPTISAGDTVASAIAGEDIEAVEGFWIPRPWLIEPVCPAPPPAPPEPTNIGSVGPGRRAENVTDSGDDESQAEQKVVPSLRWPKIGIAQFFVETDPRTRRRDARAYEAVITLKPDQPVTSQGFNLVLSGRLRALPGKGVIECVAPDPDTPPDCIISARLDRVWIEQPGVRRIVADWSGS